MPCSWQRCCECGVKCERAHIILRGSHMSAYLQLERRSAGRVPVVQQSHIVVVHRHWVWCVCSVPHHLIVGPVQAASCSALHATSAVHASLQHGLQAGAHGSRGLDAAWQAGSLVLGGVGLNVGRETAVNLLDQHLR